MSTTMETLYCDNDECHAKLECGQIGLCDKCQRSVNESLLAEAASLQTQLWDKLRELEEAIGCIVSADVDLEGQTIESLIELDGDTRG
jgi:ferredoxin